MIRKTSNRERAKRIEAVLDMCKPIVLEWEEFRNRLKEAGWKDHEVDAEIERIKHDDENGE